MDIDYIPNIQFTPISATEGSTSSSSTSLTDARPVTPVHAQYANVIDQARFYSVDKAISRIDELLAANNLTGVYYDDVNAALTNSRRLLTAQYDYLGSDETKSLNSWMAAMQKWQDLEEVCGDLARQVPWMALAYPSEYPDYADQIEEYDDILQQKNDVLADFQNLSRIHFSVADAVNVQNSFFNSLDKIFGNSTGSPGVDINKFITGALKDYRDEQTAFVRSKNLLTYRMTNAARQEKIGDLFLTAQKRRVSLTPDLRLQLMNADNKAYTTCLEDLVDGIDQDYTTRLLDLYKTYSIYTDALSALIQLEG